MRIDLEQTGNKDIDIQFNGKPIHDVIWADDVTGECFIFERDWRSGEFVRDPDSAYYGYRTLTLKGKVKISDRRPKIDRTENIHDFKYNGMCWLIVLPARTALDPLKISVHDSKTGNWVGAFWEFGLTVKEQCDLVHGLSTRLTMDSIAVDVTGIGIAVLDMLRDMVGCPINPLKP